jgi:hypothetical protein
MLSHKKSAVYIMPEIISFENNVGVPIMFGCNHLYELRIRETCTETANKVLNIKSMFSHGYSAVYTRFARQIRN